MDEPLQNGLWNVVDYEALPREHGVYYTLNSRFDVFSRRLWRDYFKRPIDGRPDTPRGVVAEIRAYFFSCEWHEVYSLLEFLARQNDSFTSSANEILEREMSAYRFVGTQIVEITSEAEIDAIEEAMGSTVSAAATHLGAALAHLSDRANPDFRNSIKESISAVEAVVLAVSDSDKGTLSAALKRLNIGAHPALEGAFSKLYGYTSDADGIRHALLEDNEKLRLEDAKFMLVACSVCELPSRQICSVRKIAAYLAQDTKRLARGRAVVALSQGDAPL